MKASPLSDAQKAFILKQGDEGVPVGEICCKAGISQATYLNSKRKYAGMLPPEAGDGEGHVPGQGDLDRACLWGAELRSVDLALHLSPTRSGHQHQANLSDLQGPGPATTEQKPRNAW